jgi:hypothetical protein
MDDVVVSPVLSSMAPSDLGSPDAAVSRNAAMLAREGRAFTVKKI